MSQVSRNQSWLGRCQPLAKAVRRLLKHAVNRELNCESTRFNMLTENRWFSFFFFSVEEGGHSDLTQRSSVLCLINGSCQKGQFCFSFSFPLIPLNSGHMPACWISSAHWANRKLRFFLSFIFICYWQEFPPGSLCWPDSPQGCGVTGAGTGSWKRCWGDGMLCQMDVAPVQSLLGLCVMRYNSQRLP